MSGIGGSGIGPDVHRTADGGFEVRMRRSSRWLAVGLVAAFVVLGSGGVGFGLLLQRLGEPVPAVFVVAGLCLFAGPVVVVSLARRQRRAAAWRVEPGGLVVGGGRRRHVVAWSDVAVLELRERGQRRPRGPGAGVGAWLRLVDVTALDRDGRPLLRLPEENDDHRLRAVFTAARAAGVVPLHVQFVERRS
ncbi:hypothetical protein [Egicoccus sp. AB-alg2]|uniref:hypothetical protein n=1 Tax=Egicoccus sp. AB-alg2 TaxID=3242693 RepID=UPI00359EBC78